MKLLTETIREKLIANGRKQDSVRGTEDEIDFRPVVKLFTPDAGCTWLLTEIDPDDYDIAFGLCDLGMGTPELGSVRLSELASVRGKLGLPVERDRYFEADKTLSAYADEARIHGRVRGMRRAVMTNQLSFEAMLCSAEDDNHRRKLDRETGHLPGTMDEALPFFRELLARHHERMMAADVEAVMALREEAHKLALRLNGGEPGILAGPDAPGCALARLTAAEEGAVPLWGQCGSFVIEACRIRVRIELEGVFGIGAKFVYWPGFSTHAADLNAPFLSETGYRSFLGIHADPCEGLGPEEFCARAIEAHVNGALKGRLRTIKKKAA